MMESSMRKRLSKNNKEDRISALPNLLLHHILSFVITLQVVQTCIFFSKRWIDVWKSHPYLDFNYGTFSSRRVSNYEALLILSKAPATLYEDPYLFTNLEYLKLKTDPKDVGILAHILNYFLTSSSTLKVCL